MFKILPKLDLWETIGSLIAYALIVSVVLVLIVGGMRLERHLVVNECLMESEIMLEGDFYYCRKQDDDKVSP